MGLFYLYLYHIMLLLYRLYIKCLKKSLHK